ncbi:MAG TPA: STAS domain-containing protein [Trebonia sp.]
MDDELSVTVRRERDVVIVEVTGDIDLSTVAGLRERLFALADSGQPLIIDLNRITFIDSTGLGVLVGVARRASVHGGSLHVVCSRPQTRNLLWLTGVDRRVPLSATVDGALMLLTASRNSPVGELPAGGQPPSA